MVGENNSGKSCLIESLRLVSKAAQGATKRIYQKAPVELDLPAIVRGFYIDTRKLRIDLGIIIYFYNTSPYAKITATFNNKAKIEIYLTNSFAFAVVYGKNNELIKTKQSAEKLGIDKIGILPPIGPIRENEKLLSTDTIVSDMDTYLSSLHFRNEIYLWKDELYKEFKANAEESWHGLRINSLDYNLTDSDYINFCVQDNGFVAEIGKMGNGLQMWLQIIWFLSRSKNFDLVILDEPDVYMHPDMQRKILELVKKKFPQIIIATHSVEIISRVEPDCILEINKKDRTMHYAADSKSVQAIIDDIGGMQNLALLNLGRKRKCLFVEGKDMYYLNRFNELLYGSQLDIPSIAFGGFSKISRVYGASNLFYNETSNQILCYALADRDYRDPIIVKNVMEEALKEHLNLHVWEKKEIENYLIVPEVLYSLIPSKFNISYDEFIVTLEKIIDQQKDSVFDSISGQYRIDCKELSEGQQWDTATCNQRARTFLSKNWTSLENKISIVGGKEFLSILAKYYKDNYHFSISAKKIIANMSVDNICQELKDFLKQLQ